MTADSLHGVGMGSSNAEERWHHAAQELARVTLMLKLEDERIEHQAAIEKLQQQLQQQA